MKRFITKYYFLPAIALLTLVSVVTVRCKKPTDGININVNTSNLFHYTAVVQIVDPSGAVPNNLTVTLSGANASAIYGIDGRKALGAPAGIIALAVHPKFEPTATSPVKFTLSITGPGYLPLIIPVTITSTQENQVIKASIFNLTVPTAGVGSTTVAATANAGTVVAPITATSPLSGGPEATSITVPTGTKLQDANGNTIVGNNVSVTVNNFNTSQQTAVNLFPGGGLSTTVDNGSGTITPAVLLPAGFANIQMFVNGVEVKKFSNPINVSMTLDPAYKNPSTGLPLAAGQTVEIDSYDTGTGQWKFEQNGTVSSVGGNLVVNFTTTHLTVYAALIKLPTLPNLKIKVTTSSPIPEGQTYPINITAKIANGPSYDIYGGQILLTSDELEFDFDSKFPVATATNPINLTFTSPLGSVAGTATVNPGVINLTITLTLTAPGPLTDLILRLDCAGAGSNKVGIFTPPDFYLFYKPAGTPVANYQVLGLVQGGDLITNQLAAAPTKYDFKAVLGSGSVKEVLNHDISENVPANQTVGGTFNGTKTPVKNQLDIQSLCNTLP